MYVYVCVSCGKAREDDSRRRHRDGRTDGRWGLEDVAAVGFPCAGRLSLPWRHAARHSYARVRTYTKPWALQSAGAPGVHQDAHWPSPGWVHHTSRMRRRWRRRRPARLPILCPVCADDARVRSGRGKRAVTGRLHARCGDTHHRRHWQHPPLRPRACSPPKGFTAAASLSSAAAAGASAAKGLKGLAMRVPRGGVG